MLRGPTPNSDVGGRSPASKVIKPPSGSYQTTLASEWSVRFVGAADTSIMERDGLESTDSNTDVLRGVLAGETSSSTIVHSHAPPHAEPNLSKCNIPNELAAEFMDNGPGSFMFSGAYGSAED